MEEFARKPEQQARDRRLCLERAADWRGQAEHVRDHAAQPHLMPDVRAGLLRNACICDDEAEYWEAGAQEYLP